MRTPLSVPDAVLQAMAPLADEFLRAQQNLRRAVAIVAAFFPGLDPATVTYDPTIRAFHHISQEPASDAKRPTV